VRTGDARPPPEDGTGRRAGVIAAWAPKSSCVDGHQCELRCARPVGRGGIPAPSLASLGLARTVGGRTWKRQQGTRCAGAAASAPLPTLRPSVCHHPTRPGCSRAGRAAEGRRPEAAGDGSGRAQPVQPLLRVPKARSCNQNWLLCNQDAARCNQNSDPWLQDFLSVFPCKPALSSSFTPLVTNVTSFRQARRRARTRTHARARTRT